MIQFSEKLESKKVLDLLSRSLPYYLKSWHEIDPNTGLFGKIDPHSFNMKEIGSSSPVIEYVIPLKEDMAELKTEVKNLCNANTKRLR